MRSEHILGRFSKFFEKWLVIVFCEPFTEISGLDDDPWMRRRLGMLSADAPKAGREKQVAQMRRRLGVLSTNTPKAGAGWGGRIGRRLGRTHARTDGRTDGRTESTFPPSQVASILEEMLRVQRLGALIWCSEVVR